MTKIFKISLIWALLVVLWGVLPSSAQLPRSQRTKIRHGRMITPDKKLKNDSLRRMAQLDSLRKLDLSADSLSADSVSGERLTGDSLHGTGRVDSIALAKSTGADLPIDTLTEESKAKKHWFMPDSMSLSKVCWLSTVLPGYGQIYNKQYWKLPLLYGLVGTSIALYAHENKTYKPLKNAYNAYTNMSVDRTPELNALQSKMIRSNTRRQIYLGAAIASYLYFIGDAAVNYKTNDVSHVKKATTLACLFPGAGQIYNKSYWKVPFVVGGFASMVYCIDWNNRGYKRFKKAYGLIADYEAHPENYPDGPKDEFRGRYSATFVRDLRNNYRRNRDLCIIITGALYVLQIIDAHVDAHLKDYDISDDLSMSIEPMVDYPYIPSQGGNRTVFGFNLNVNF